MTAPDSYALGRSDAETQRLMLQHQIYVAELVVLMYVEDPAKTVREPAGRLRPGGVVAFQEGVFNEVRAPFPNGPLHEQVLQWMTPPPGAPGPDVQMGFKLKPIWTSGPGAPG